MENNKKMHVVITNNETGEVMLDKQSDGIIAAIEHEEGIAAFAVMDCKGLEIIKLLLTARGVCDDIAKDKPELDKMVKLAELFHHMNEAAGEDADADQSDADSD